jgi:transposase
VNIDRETDVEQLRRIALALQVANRHLVDVLARKCKELEALKGDPNELQRTLALLESATQQAQAALAGNPARKPKPQPKPPREQAAKGPTPQPRLPIEERVFVLDDADRACPSCGGELAPMAGQFETSEMIDVVQVEYKLVQVKQQKYVCRCGSCVETAIGPERASAGSRYSLDLAIKVVVDKYLDHLPLARQVRIMERLGLDVTSQTLWDLAYAVDKRLAPIDEALFKHVLAQPVMGLDQTGWARLESGDGKPWQMWCLTAPGVVVHRIRHDKSAATFVELVGNYHGTIVCDALATHAAGAREGPGIVLAGCWAHVIRKFKEAAVDHPDAERALAWIGALYEIDARAGTDDALRGQLRRSESFAVLNELKAWLWDLAALKKLSIGNAAAYTIGNWERLTRFVEDPRIPLDNNATERAIRGPVVGRRNHFGSKSRQGTAVAATLYSLVETAKLHDIDPVRYLREAILAADRGEVLLPWQLAR